MNRPPTLRSILTLLATLSVLSPAARAQPANTSQQLVFAGLRSVAGQGQINAVKTDPAGNLYLLLDQGDGVRLLKTDNAASTILAQSQLGATGDSGVSLALDPAGNVYVTGTTTSTTLAATSGAAIPTRTDASTNSFVAKFDPTLHPIFVSFTGGSRIAATALAATADAVFVTGLIYGSNLPVTQDGIQQSPAYGSTQNGFVERFSADGGTLVYATYLTGASGDTTPAAIAADSLDNAYLAGATTASGFPTIAALVSESLSTPSGFLAKLNPAGDAIVASTFIPGPGLTGLAIDASIQTLLVSGSVSLGQFPVDTVDSPLIPTTYQVLLRLPMDLSAVQSSTLLAPGTQSNVAAASSGTAWIDGVLTAPLLPLAPLADTGTGFALRVNSANIVDQTARFGGLPNLSPAYASLPALLTSLAVDPSGQPLIAGSVQPTASSSLLTAETFDLPFRNAPNTPFPSAVRDAEPTAASCNGGSLCSGSAAFLARLNPAVSAPALAFSTDALPFIVLRNLGSADALNLQLTATSGTLTSNCPTSLPAGGQCNLLLSGGTSGTLTATSTGDIQSVAYPTFSATPPASTIVFYPKELDFGIQTSTSSARTRTITVSNLGATTQTFTSALDAVSNSRNPVASPFYEYGGDCPLTGSASVKSLAPGGTCHVILGLNASATAANDGLLNANWSIGYADVLLTGYSQAAALSVSVPEIDFGTQYTTGIHLPRYLYLSNSSSAAAAHAAITLPAGSPFTLTDSCPATLLPASVCRIRIDYRAAQSTTTDSATLALDGGLSVLITGKTLPPKSVTGATVNPNLSFTPSSLTFSGSTVVTGLSGTAQTVSITNTGTSAFTLTLALTGDFTQVTSCGASLSAGQTCAVTLTFAPAQPGTRTGLLAITAGVGTTPAYVTLTGTGTAILAANNGTLDSGSVPVNQPATQFYKILQPFNTLTLATTGPYTVTLVEDVGYGPGTPPASSFLASGSSSCHNCYLGVRFQPTATGAQAGTLTLSSITGGTPYVLSLTGTGVPITGLILSPQSQDFSTAPVGSTSGSTLFTLTNLSATAAPVTVSAPALTGDFAAASLSPGLAPCGGTLAYNASCYVQVAFTPTSTGSRTGTLTLSTPGTTATATLTGLGTPGASLTVNPLALTFNNVSGPTATTQTVTLTNTGGIPYQIAAPVPTAGFAATTTCGTLAPSASCTVTVTFQPAAATTTGTLSVSATNTPPGSQPQTSNYTIALSGTYTAATAGLQMLPATTLYGTSPVQNETSPRVFTVTNFTAKTLALNVFIPSQFVLVGAPCTTLAPSASCTFSAAFLPLTDGDISGTLSAQATHSDGSPAITSLAYVEGFGTGTAALTLTGGLIANGIYSFGQVSAGQTRTQTFTLTNPAAATAPVTIRRITSPPPFLSTTTCAAPLAPAQTCTVTVTYTPQAPTSSSSPADTASLTIESDAASSPTVLNLSGQPGTGGTGGAAPLATFNLSQGSLTFPTVSVGNASPTQSVTLANTGNITLNIASITAPADFTVANPCTAIAPGTTCTLTVSSTPQSAGTHIASLEIASDSSTSLQFVSLFSVATPSPLTLTPTSLDFGSLNVGTTATQPIQVVNTTSSPATFTALAATGDYTLSGTCPAPGGTLAPSATCTVQVTFKPTAPGIRPGVLSLTSSATTLPLTVSLTGIGTASKLVITPSSLAFGSVAVGAPSNLSLTLQNNGTAAVTGLVLTATGDYAVTTPCPQSTLAIGATCTAQVTFTPTAVGSRPGTLTVTSSDPSSPATVPLTGTGVQGGGSFTLTVDGGPASTVTVTAGSPATYHLTLAATGGYSGTVALTCAPVNPAPYATCSLLPPSLTLAAGTQLSIATITTVASTGGNALLIHRRSLSTPYLCLLAPGLLVLWRGRRHLRRRLPLLLALAMAAFALTTTGCGGKADPNIRYTSAGTYQYQVTATSTAGVQITQTVTLNLVVNPH